ncbi:MAG TPA: protein kinase [Woeseiaceae bacterium]|nr:protein kinase [Woeseiaceae bacterium]
MNTAELESSAATYRTGQNLIAGRYRTQDRIGNGRLGEIFSAVDETYKELGVERQVAIQVIPEKIVRNNTLFNKINVGYSVLRAAAHPHIVSFLNVGRDGRFGFVVMDLLDGVSLRQVLQDSATLPPAEAKPVIRSIGEALRLLHAKDMVHGNLTTGNIFITQEFDVQLLDVVPLDSEDAIFRGTGSTAGTASSDPFSRSTVTDDVFGLACLAYEMLAGKHPFNHSAPADARMAGLEAERIPALTDSEWNALRLALSFDRAQRPASIADFMRDFGIEGTERLQQTDEPMARHEYIEYPAVEEAVPVARVDVPLQTTAPDPAAEFIARPKYRPLTTPPAARPTRKKPRSLRAWFLGALLAALVAWTYLGEPEEHMVGWIGYVDARANAWLAERSSETSEIVATEAEPSVATDDNAPAEAIADSAPAAVIVSPLVDSEAKGSAPGSAATVAEAPTAEPDAMPAEPELAAADEEAAVVSSAPSADQPTPGAAQPTIESTASASGETTASTTQDAASATVAAPVQAAPASDVFKSSITVYESDGAARIVPPSTGILTSPLIWWTSELTAKADQDFIATGQQEVPDLSMEKNKVLLVPLINDNLPEPMETFFVNFGIRETQHGQIERIATVRVDIIDDD